MPTTSFTTGPNTPSTAADGGGGGIVWTNPSNAKVEDGVLATAALVGPGGGGGVANQLKTTNCGFNIPSKAVIDGIKLEIKAQAVSFSNPNVLLVGSAITTAQSTTNNPAWTNTLNWLTYGGATDTWGRTWTPAEINNTAFGASLSAYPNTGTTTLSVDSVRITVYWHYSVDVAVADVPKRYRYKFFNNENFLGNLPNVISPFGYSLDINSVGASLNIECAISADTASQKGNRLVTEAGDPLTDELGNYLYTDGQPQVIGVGSSVDPYMIQNGNRVEVWEYSYYYPNGRIVFKGQVNRINAGFGTSSDNRIKILVLSDGLDLDNFIARGAPFNYTADVTVIGADSYVVVSQEASSAGYTRFGQTWTAGAGVSKLGAIYLLCTGVADVTVTVYDAVNSATPLATTTQHVDSIGIQTLVTFGFASLINVSAGSTYFFNVSVGAGQLIVLYNSLLNPYAGGKMYTAVYSGGSGGGSYSEVAGNDLYFIAASGTPTTAATYTLQDPSTGMLKPIIDDYKLRGGRINYSASSVDATGLSLTVMFNTETILDAIKKCLSVAPNGFYFYVDLGTNTIYFKQTLTTATYKLIKGRHLNKIDLVMSIENLKNDVLFSGAEIAGTNLYTEYTDQASKTLYGQRLVRKSDNRVSLQPTADAIGNSYIAENKGEYFETVVTIPDKTMDIGLLRPGQTVGLRGFGSFVDTLTLQIVRVEYSPTQATLTLGNLPKRFTNEFENLIRGLVAEQTVANPSAPS